MVTALGDSGHVVDLLCYPFGDDLEIENVNIIRSPRPIGINEVKVGPSLAKFPLGFLMMLKAFWLCLRRKYEVIHAVEESAFFALFLKKIFKTKFIYDMDSVISDQLKYTGFTAIRPVLALAERLETAAMRNADFVITVCDSLSELIQERSPETGVVQIEDAPVQTNFQEERQAASKLRSDLDLGDSPCIVYTGNLESYQGVDLLIRAAAQACKANSTLRFVIVGGEEEQIEHLQDLATKLDISEICIFTGKLAMAEMPAFMTMADVLVSPRTKGTNTALKIYTYMQSGRPIVATRLPTHTQVLDDSCSYLVLPQVDDLAEGVLRAVRERDENSEIPNEARKRVASKYSLPRFNSQVRTAYKSLPSPLS